MLSDIILSKMCTTLFYSNFIVNVQLGYYNHAVVRISLDDSLVNRGLGWKLVPSGKNIVGCVDSVGLRNWIGEIRCNKGWFISWPLVVVGCVWCVVAK